MNSCIPTWKPGMGDPQLFIGIHAYDLPFWLQELPCTPFTSWEHALLGWWALHSYPDVLIFFASALLLLAKESLPFWISLASVTPFFFFSFRVKLKVKKIVVLLYDLWCAYLSRLNYILQNSLPVCFWWWWALRESLLQKMEDEREVSSYFVAHIYLLPIVQQSTNLDAMVKGFWDVIKAQNQLNLIIREITPGNSIRGKLFSYHFTEI